jgi:acetyl-CoA carboxylase carboxyltransferase component
MKENSTAGITRLTSFFDEGTFVELGAYIRRLSSEEALEGVVCGYGSLGGRLVFAFAQDSTSMKGALDGRHAEKIARTYEKALAVGAPIVGFFDCAGAVVFDGAAALAGSGTLLRTVSGASGKIPQIAVISGTCAGTMASVAALFDPTVTVKDKSRLYVSSPTLIDEEIGTAAYAFEHGNAAILAEGEDEALMAVRKLLSYLPDNAEHGIPSIATADNPGRALSLGSRCTAKEALDTAVDAGSFYEVLGGFGEAVTAGFASMGGVSTVVLAMDGELTLTSIVKMRRMIAFADAFGLPVVTLVNAGGVAVSAADESALAIELAALAKAQTSARAPRVTAIVGDAVGAGFIFGGSRALGADLVLALPDAEIAALNASAAVAFLWNDRITPELTREALEKEWRETCATAEAAAATGEVDDIVSPAELRARLIAALFMLAGKR